MTTSHARRALVLIATGMVAGACTGPLVGICSSSVPSHLAMATSAFPIMFLTGFFGVPPPVLPPGNQKPRFILVAKHTHPCEHIRSSHRLVALAEVSGASPVAPGSSFTTAARGIAQAPTMKREYQAAA